MLDQSLNLAIRGPPLILIPKATKHQVVPTTVPHSLKDILDHCNRDH